MKILFIIPTLGCGGAEILLGNICIELTKKGHFTKVICLNEPLKSYENYPNKIEFINCAKPEIIKYSIDFSATRLLRISSLHLKNKIEEFSPDVIHSHLFLAELVSRCFYYKNAVYFSHGHDNMFQLEKLGYETTKKRKWYHYTEKLWLTLKYRKLENNFIAISHDTFEFFKRSLPKKLHTNISLLHNAINYSNFSNKIRQFTSLKLKLVSIGSLVAKKNHLFLIEVAKELKNKKIDFEITILGDGPLMKKLKEAIKNEHLENYIILKGNVGDIPNYLNNADIYLHPATYEPFGLVILEAMASGLPVICLNGKGNVGLNVEGKTGFMTDSPDAEKFADKILYLINNSVEYSKISEYCVNFSKDYDIENYCKKLVDLYQNAIDKKFNSK